MFSKSIQEKLLSKRKYKAVKHFWFVFVFFFFSLNDLATEWKTALQSQG